LSCIRFLHSLIYPVIILQNLNIREMAKSMREPKEATADIASHVCSRETKFSALCESIRYGMCTKVTIDNLDISPNMMEIITRAISSLNSVHSEKIANDDPLDIPLKIFHFRANSTVRPRALYNSSFSMPRLINVLLESPTLIELELSFLNMSAECFQAISVGLQSSAVSLKKLNIEGNYLDYSSLLTLRRNLGENTKLTSLLLTPPNRTTPQELQLIKEINDCIHINTSTSTEEPAKNNLSAITCGR
jgi:hypothetical protein